MNTDYFRISNCFSNLRFSWSVMTMVRQQRGGGDAGATAGPAESADLLPVGADGCRVDVPVLVDLERVEDAAVHEADLGVVAGGVHGRPAQSAVSGPRRDHAHDGVEGKQGLRGDDAVLGDVLGVGGVQLLADENGVERAAGPGHPVGLAVLD